MGLSYTASAQPSQLTLAETHMASIARALIVQPQIVLIDDMAAELSERDREQIKGILHALFQYGKYTFLEFSGTEEDLLQTNRTIPLEHGKTQEDQS